MNKLKLSLAVTVCLILMNGFARAQQQEGASTNSGTATMSASNGAGQTGIRDYLLGPGDVMELRVFNETQFDGSLEVTNDGSVTVPFVEVPIQAACRRVEDVRKDVVAALGKMLRKPQVNLQIKERRSRVPAVVYGAVQSPQRFEMNRRVRLLELISYSGGFTEKAAGTIQITHTQQQVCAEPEQQIEAAHTSAVDTTTSDAETTAAGLPLPKVYNVEDIKMGKDSANPFIRPGDVIRVDEAQPIYVTGSVVAPQGVYLRDNMTLTRAIAMVGGLRKEAKKDKVLIRRRTKDEQQYETIAVNYEAIRKQKQSDIVLQPYDIVEVSEAGVFTAQRLPEFFLGLASQTATSLAGNAPLRVLY